MLGLTREGAGIISSGGEKVNSFLKSLRRNDLSKYEFGSLQDDRVTLNPNPPHNGDSVHINYQGLLKNSGAHSVYLHYGFDNWSSEVATVKMEHQGNGIFEAMIPAHHHGHHEMNFCFKDCANNWDNNNGSNWNVSFQ